MPIMRLMLEEPAWPELTGNPKVEWAPDESIVQITGLSGGMASGKPSVAVRVDLPEGRIVLFQTSLALFLTAADGLKARFGDPRY